MPFRVHQSKKRGHGVTLYAAIGTHLNRMVTHLDRGTTIVGYQAFVQQLIDELPYRRPYTRKPILVLDNARPHYNKIARKQISNHVHIEFMPTSSCCFNSVETAFSKLKRSYKSRITKIALRRDYQMEDLYACLNLAIEEVTPDMQRRLCRANYAYMNEFLPVDKQLVRDAEPV